MSDASLPPTPPAGPGPGDAAPAPVPADQEMLTQGNAVRDLTAYQLSPDQQKVLRELLVGSSLAYAAQATGVSRTTVYRWLKDHAQFREAYEQWKEDMAVTGRNKLLMLVDDAVEAIRGALNHGDPHIAFKLVDRMGITGAPAIGPTYDELRAENLRLRNEIQRCSHATEAEVAAYIKGSVTKEANETDGRK